MSLRAYLNSLRKLERRIRQRILSRLLRVPGLSGGVAPPFAPSAPQSFPDEGSDITVAAGQCTIRFIASERLELQQSYKDWISPLAKLPSNASFEELKAAIAALQGFQDNTRLFFPLEEYLQSIKVKHNQEWLQYGLASGHISKELLLSLLHLPPDESHVEEPAVVVIHAACG